MLHWLWQFSAAKHNAIACVNWHDHGLILKLRWECIADNLLGTLSEKGL